MDRVNWIAIDDMGTMVASTTGPRSELVGRLIADFPEGAYTVMRVEHVERVNITIKPVAEKVRR